MRRERIPILSVLAFVRGVFKIEKEHVLNTGQVTAKDYKEDGQCAKSKGRSL